MWYGGECTYKNMDAICQKAVTEKADMIIGVGGGKALDTAKGASEKLGIPIITVPTIGATCAAVTSLSIVYSEHGDFDSLFQLSTPTNTYLYGQQCNCQCSCKISLGWNWGYYR